MKNLRLPLLQFVKVLVPTELRGVTYKLYHFMQVYFGVMYIKWDGLLRIHAEIWRKTKRGIFWAWQSKRHWLLYLQTLGWFLLWSSEICDWSDTNFSKMRGRWFGETFGYKWWSFHFTGFVFEAPEMITNTK